jgi:uncharacterized membrane protein YccC
LTFLHGGSLQLEFSCSDARFQAKGTAGLTQKGLPPANCARAPCRVDYSNHLMESDEELRTETDPPGTASEARASETAQQRSEPAGKTNRHSAPLESKPKELSHAPLNKWQSFWGGVLHIDVAKIDPWIALRNAAGVGAPLVVGTVIGMPLGGLAVASGALNVSYSDGHDPYGQRAKRMLAASVLCAFAVMAGGLAGRHNVAATLLATVWAFGSGMAIALGPTAENLGVVSLVVLIIYSAQSLTPERALQAGGLAFAGGVIQMLLSLALWPVRTFEPERRALANLYLTLAKAAASPASLMKAPPPAEASTQAQQALAARSTDHGIESERFVSLLNQAERMRLGLFTLGRLLRRMRREKFGFASAEMVETFLEAASRAMASIGDSLGQGLPLEIDESSLQEMRHATEALREKDNAADRTFLAAVVRDARHQMDALAGQLRAAVQLAADVSPWGLQVTRDRDKARPWRMRITGGLARVTANLTLQSAVCRHAVRLAVAVAIAEVAARNLETPRAYWLPMTTVLVLKPEFTVTFTRGLLRIGGTIAGLLLATAMFHFLPSGRAAEIVLIAAFVFVLRWVGPANYGIFGIAVSALVVLLIAFTGVAPKDVILARGIHTVMGGILALAIYAVWPTWERMQVGEMMARLMDAYCDYFASVVEELTRADGSISVERLDKARLAARLARTNAVASVERMRAEPGTRVEEIALLSGMLASSHRFAYAVMSVEAGILPSARPPVRPEFRVFAADVVATLKGISATLRRERQPQKLPDLREDHRRLIESQAAGERYALMNVEADRMTNSLNTLREQAEAWKALTDAPLREQS